MWEIKDVCAEEKDESKQVDIVRDLCSVSIYINTQALGYAQVFGF